MFYKRLSTIGSDDDAVTARKTDAGIAPIQRMIRVEDLPVLRMRTTCAYAHFSFIESKSA